MGLPAAWWNRWALGPGPQPGGKGSLTQLHCVGFLQSRISKSVIFTNAQPRFAGVVCVCVLGPPRLDAPESVLGISLVLGAMHEAKLRAREGRRVSSKSLTRV